MRKIALLMVSVVCLSSMTNLSNENFSLTDEPIFWDSSVLDCSNQTHASNTPFHVDNQLGKNSNPGTVDCPFESVAKAILESSDGDEIIVHEGVYHEEVSVDGFQNLTIKSAQGERVIFDGTQSVVNDLGGSWLLSGDGIHEVDLGVDAWQVFMD